MSEFQDLSRSLSLELETLEQYERGDLALTSNQLTELHSVINDLKKRRLAACTHENVQGIRETDYYRDDYGSPESRYACRLKCLDCDQTLLEKFSGSNYIMSWNGKTPTYTLQEGCIWWDKQPGGYSSRDANKIEDYGVRKVERRVVEYVSTR